MAPSRPSRTGGPQLDKGLDRSSSAAPYSLHDVLKVLWGQIMAYSTLITIPVLLMFLALQRQFIRSIASAGVKG